MPTPQQFRGVHYDLARGNYDSYDSLRALVTYMAECGLNELVLYMEDLWRYPSHPKLANAHAYDIADMGRFAAWSAEQGVDFIPSLTTLGHARHILEKPEYRHLAFPGERADFDVLNPAVYQLFAQLFDDVLPHFTSPYVFINGDEVNLSAISEDARALAREQGIGALYGMGMQRMAQMVLARGRRPIMWHDMLLHHPDSLAWLPKETIIAYWFYDYQPKFEAIDYFAKQGYDVLAAPGILYHGWLPDDARALPNLVGQARAASASPSPEWGEGAGRCLGTMTTIWEKLRWRDSMLAIYATGRWSNDSAASEDAVLADFAGDVFGMDAPTLGAAWVEASRALGQVYRLGLAQAGRRDATTQAELSAVADAARANLAAQTAVIAAGTPAKNPELHARAVEMAAEMRAFQPEAASYDPPTFPLLTPVLVDPADTTCRVIEARTEFGHRLCVVTNGLLAIAVLPEFGGVMLEWTLLGDRPWSVVGANYPRWAAASPKVPGDPALGSPWGANRLGGWRSTIYYNARLQPSSQWGRPCAIETHCEGNAVALICRGGNEVGDLEQVIRLMPDSRLLEITLTATNRFAPGFLGLQPNPTHLFPGVPGPLVRRVVYPACDFECEVPTNVDLLLEHDGTMNFIPPTPRVRLEAAGHYLDLRYRADEVERLLTDVGPDAFTLEPFSRPRFCQIGESVSMHLTYEVG